MKVDDHTSDIVGDMVSVSDSENDAVYVIVFDGLGRPVGDMVTDASGVLLRVFFVGDSDNEMVLVSEMEMETVDVSEGERLMVALTVNGVALSCDDSEAVNDFGAVALNEITTVPVKTRDLLSV